MLSAEGKVCTVIGGAGRLKYLEREPVSAMLKPHVKCVWTLRRSYPGDGAGEVLWPDPCKEILFHHGRVFRDRGELLPDSCVMGTLSGYRRLDARGDLVLYGIRLQPWGLSLITDRPVRAFNDRFTPLAELLADREACEETRADRPARKRERPTPRMHLERLERLEHRLAAADMDEAQSELELFLESLIDPSRADLGLCAVLGRLTDRPETYTVADAARDLGVSLRQLERRCLKATGLTPKRLHKIARFNRVRLRLLWRPDLDLRDLMVEAGYYDYSHFSKDFHECLGLAPARFQAWAARLASDHGPRDVEFLQDNSGENRYDAG